MRWLHILCVFALLCSSAAHGQPIKVRTLAEQGMSEEDRQACEELKEAALRKLEQRIEQLEEDKLAAGRDKDRERMKTLIAETKEAKADLLRAKNKPAEEWYGDLLEARNPSKPPIEAEPPPVRKEPEKPVAKRQAAPPRAAAAVPELKRWSVIDSVDELTQEKVRGVITFSEGASGQFASLLVAFQNNGTFDLSLYGSKFELFIPDDLLTRKVAVSYRAKDSPLRNTTWTVAPNNKSAFLTNIDPDSLQEMFSGESLIMQLDRMGKRYTFNMAGQSGEDLRALLQKELKAAGNAPAADGQ